MQIFSSEIDPAKSGESTRLGGRVVIRPLDYDTVIRRAKSRLLNLFDKVKNSPFLELLTLKKVGNQTHYQANPASPVYNELISISRKTFGIADVIREALKVDGSFLADGSSLANSSIQYAFIYGSIAKGEDTAKSDIDLMIIGDDLAYTDMMNLLIPIEKELQRPINSSIYSLNDFKEKLEKKNSFLTRVMAQDKINVIGDADAIG